MVEGSGHQYFVDSSPKVYKKDVDGDGNIESVDGDEVILVCGERKGGTSYLAIDVTDPSSPELKWRINQKNDAEAGTLELQSISGTFQNNEALTGGSGGVATVDGTLVGNDLLYDAETSSFGVGEVVTGGTSGATGTIVSITNHAPPDADPVVISQLGESWSEPKFGLVKTFDGDTSGTAVMFIGGGYTSDNSLGKAVLAISVSNGSAVKIFENDASITDMDYSFASQVRALDTNSNGFIDKVYVGDLGSQMWRFGKFTDFIGNPLGFPNADENITNWDAEVLFLSDATHTRKFFYPPNITLERGYDLVFVGTGDRDDACATSSSERIYCIKDTHTSTTLEESDLVDVTDPAATLPDLSVDQGWYIQMAAGEKVLAEGMVFYKTLYITTFTPNNDPCLPGGVGKLYALHYSTGEAVLYFGEASKTRSVSIGGGIPSKPVIVITEETPPKLFISVGSTNPDDNSESFDAGLVAVDPLAPPINFFYLWWVELIG
jgi:Tfp pilus tip-associated adhesin PilY1